MTVPREPSDLSVAPGLGAEARWEGAAVARVREGSGPVQAQGSGDGEGNRFGQY